MASKAIWLLTLAILLAGCSQQPADSSGQNQRLSLSQAMSGSPDPGFARAYQPREFVFPQDHLAHDEFATEWWYFTGNLQTPTQRRFGYQLTIFRTAIEPVSNIQDTLATDNSGWQSNQIYMGHIAISDMQHQRHISHELFSRDSHAMAGTALNPLRIWLGPLTIEGSDNQLLPLTIKAQSGAIAIDLQLTKGTKPLVLQGDNGLSQKGAEPGNASYYYSYTRLPTQGTLRINQQHYRVSGNSWFDREWSSSALAEDQAGWDWFALQLDDGRDLMFYQMRGVDGKAQPFSKGILIDQQGAITKLTLDNTELSGQRFWQSAEQHAYPLSWQLKNPALGLDLLIEAAFDEQLMQHTLEYWEGAVTVTGSHQGVGYMELSGYSQPLISQ